MMEPHEFWQEIHGHLEAEILEDLVRPDLYDISSDANKIENKMRGVSIIAVFSGISFVGRYRFPDSSFFITQFRSGNLT